MSHTHRSWRWFTSHHAEFAELELEEQLHVIQLGLREIASHDLETMWCQDLADLIADAEAAR